MGYYTYTAIPTNSQGVLHLTQEQIIQNTELKHHYDSTLTLDNRPVKFEIFILYDAFLSTLILSIGNYLSSSLTSAIADLRRRGFSEIQIEQEIPKIEKVKKKDSILYKCL